MISLCSTGFLEFIYGAEYYNNIACSISYKLFRFLPAIGTVSLKFSRAFLMLSAYKFTRNRESIAYAYAAQMQYQINARIEAEVVNN